MGYEYVLKWIEMLDPSIDKDIWKNKSLYLQIELIGTRLATKVLSLDLTQDLLSRTTSKSANDNDAVSRRIHQNSGLSNGWLSRDPG